MLRGRAGVLIRKVVARSRRAFGDFGLKCRGIDILASGRTGLAEIDTWIVAHNPHGLDRPATVVSADSRGTTWR